MKTQNRQYLSYDDASTLHLQALTPSESPRASFLRRRHTFVLHLKRKLVKFVKIRQNVVVLRIFVICGEEFGKMKLSESQGGKMGFQSFESNSNGTNVGY